MGFYNGSNGVLYGYGHLRGFGSLVIHTYTHTYIYIERERALNSVCGSELRTPTWLHQSSTRWVLPDLGVLAQAWCCHLSPGP